MPDLKQTISNTDLIYAVTQQWFLKLDFLLLLVLIIFYLFPKIARTSNINIKLN